MKILVINGSPIVGLPDADMACLVYDAIANNQTVSYEELDQNPMLNSLYGFQIGNQFYEWRHIPELPREFRAFWQWDIVGDKLFNSKKFVTMLEMKRGKLHMKIGTRWLRANLIRKNVEFVIANQE